MFARRCVCQLHWAATHRLTPALGRGAAGSHSHQHRTPTSQATGQPGAAVTSTRGILTTPPAIIKHRQTLTVQRSDDDRHHHHHQTPG